MSVVGVLLIISFGESQSGELGDVHVICCVDEGYAGPVAVMLTSMFENANPNTFYHVYIQISGGFKTEIKLKISSLKMKYINCKVDFIDMGTMFKNMSGKVPGIHFGYFLSAGLLPDVKKVLFLDADMIVRHDLFHLYDTNINDYYFAGVVDPFEAYWGSERTAKHLKLLNLTDLNQYINTGVTLLNLEKFREEKVEEQFLSRMDKEKENIRNGKLLGGQDIINPVGFGRILLLPLKYNAMINMINIFEPFEKNIYAQQYSTKESWKEAQDPTIVHFLWQPKPWFCEGVSKSIFHEEFWIYASKTDFYGKGGLKSCIRSRSKSRNRRRKNKLTRSANRNKEDNL